MTAFSTTFAALFPLNRQIHYLWRRTWQAIFFSLVLVDEPFWLLTLGVWLSWLGTLWC